MNFNGVTFEAAYGTAEQLPVSDMPEICFSGRSNVGKSSLINKIVNRKSFARVSSTPGKTVTVNFYKLKDIRLVDLPGYGYAKVDDKEKLRWAELMEEYFTSGRNIALVFQLVDMRHGASDYDISMLDFMKNAQIPFKVVLTKCDKLNKEQYNSQLEDITEQLKDYLTPADIIPFSSLKSIGVEQVRNEIETAYR